MGRGSNALLTSQKPLAQRGISNKCRPILSACLKDTVLFWRPVQQRILNLLLDGDIEVRNTHDTEAFWNNQGWVIRRRRTIRRIVFITYISVFFELLRIIRFWELNEFCSHKPPRAPQKHSQALKSPTEALPSPLEPPRGTPSPSERSMITCLLLPQPRRWCL